MKFVLSLAGLLLIGCSTACGSSSSSALQAAPRTQSAPPASSTPASQPSTTPTPVATSAPSGSATLVFSDGEGNKWSQVWSFAQPVAESTLPQVASATGASSDCAPVGNPGPSQDLAIPFTAITSLDSSMSVSTSFYIAAADILNGVIVYNGSTGLTCVAGSDSNSVGISLNLSPGSSFNTQGWIVLFDEINPDHPHGDAGDVGQQGIVPTFYNEPAPITAASGPDACTGENTATTPIWVHIGGTVTGSDECGGGYKAPA
jgi:hypothetical protein